MSTLKELEQTHTRRANATEIQGLLTGDIERGNEEVHLVKLHRMISCCRLPSCRALCVAVAVSSAWLAAPAAFAQQIDLSLNVIYNDPAIPDSGGTWSLSAKTSNFGLASLGVYLKGIDFELPEDILLTSPTGFVNTTDAAGFDIFLASPVGENVQIALTQPPIDPTNGPEYGLIYGVGSIDNAPDGGAPNYPGQPAGTLSEGSEITSLTGVLNGVWGTADPLMDAAWDSAAVLFEGTFGEGKTPDFFEDVDEGFMESGNVFLTTGSATTAGNISLAENTIVTTVVRSNLILEGGDYNGDGIVDAADYVIWRNNLGASVTPGTGADGNLNGVIDESDYVIWKNNFGNMFPPGSLTGLSPQAVPEPKSLVFCVVLLGLVALWRQPANRLRMFF